MCYLVKYSEFGKEENQYELELSKKKKTGGEDCTSPVIGRMGWFLDKPCRCEESIGNSGVRGDMVRLVKEIMFRARRLEKQKLCSLKFWIIVQPWPLTSCMTWSTLFHLSGLCLALLPAIFREERHHWWVGAVRKGFRQEGVEMGLKTWVGFQEEEKEREGHSTTC